MKRLLLPLLALCLVTTKLFAWTDGELLVRMDNDRRRALAPIVEKFKTDLGLKVRSVAIETPENFAESFPKAGQTGKGPGESKLIIATLQQLYFWATFARKSCRVEKSSTAPDLWFFGECSKHRLVCA
jgi:hypothetical protein